MDNCPSWKGCNASICPLEPSSVQYSLWYPGEDICKALAYRQERWYKNQRKINRLFNKGQIDDDRYFTYAMLSSIERVGKGIRGKDPDKWTDDTAP